MYKLLNVLTVIHATIVSPRQRKIVDNISSLLVNTPRKIISLQPRKRVKKLGFWGKNSLLLSTMLNKTVLFMLLPSEVIRVRVSIVETVTEFDNGDCH